MMRVLPPYKGDRPSITVFGRSYTCALGSFLDVPDSDGQVLAANKWTRCGQNSGATTARPSAPSKDQTFLDTTLGFIVVFDGLVWRNPATGAQV